MADSPDIAQANAPSDEAGPSAERPSQRIRIGSQRKTFVNEYLRESETPAGETPSSQTPSSPAPSLEAPANESGETKPNPVTPTAPPPKPAAKREPKYYPPPNIRDRLSPELELEFQAALGDLSLEALINEAAIGEVTPELAPESRVNTRVTKVSREDVFVE